MKAGQPVTYVDARGTHTAVVAAVVGTGESRFKVLDLDLTDGRRFQGVPHENDRVEGQGYWTGDVEPEPELEPKVDPEPEPEPKPTRRRKGR